jgi:hypothetical protein
MSSDDHTQLAADRSGHWSAQVSAHVVRNSMAWLLGALVALFVLAPLVESVPGGSYLEASLLTGVLISSVLALRGRAPLFSAAIFLGAAALASRWAYHLHDESLLPFAQSVFIAFVVFVLFHFFRFVFRAQRVSSEVLCAALNIYLLMILIWSNLYGIVAFADSNAFRLANGEPLEGFNTVYFSIIAMTTVGFGDIAPVSNLARMLTGLEALTGTIYIAVVLARYVSASRTHPDENSDLPA